ncbi:MAG: LeuA family protein [Ignavibacteriales bacterium]
MSSEKWCLSPLNSSKEVMRKPLPASVPIYDSTLRDGEQTIGVCFSPEERVRIAKELEAIGVKRIEAGMPVVSAEDKQAVSEVVKTIKKSQVWTLCRCTRKDVEASAEAGVKNVLCEIATSPFKMRAYGYTEEGVLGKIVDTLKYASSNGMYTAFFAVDATRADLKFLERAYKAAVLEGGAREVTLVDTLGVASPETIEYMAELIQGWVKVPLMVHCHNDFGMAVACSVAAVKAGASMVHVTVNGLGEKTGNADLAEVVFALEGLYGINTGINLNGLIHLSKMLEEITHVHMSPLKPVVGKTVFQRESGVTVAQLVAYPPSVEGYSPELIGAEREIMLSKKSGASSIEHFLAKNGLKASPEKVNEILAGVKSLGIKKRGLVTEQEFLDIAKAVL